MIHTAFLLADPAPFRSPPATAVWLRHWTLPYNDFAPATRPLSHRWRSPCSRLCPSCYCRGASSGSATQSPASVPTVSSLPQGSAIVLPLSVLPLSRYTFGFPLHACRRL